MSKVIKRLSVDRVESGTAVLLDGRAEVNVPASWLPEGAGEGSHLKITIRADAGAEDEARARVGNLQSRLKRR